MKKVLFLVFWGLFCHIASFAHDGIRQLVQFYKSADMDGYYSMAQRNINEDLSQLYRNGGCVELKIPIPFVEITNEQGSGKFSAQTHGRTSRTRILVISDGGREIVPAYVAESLTFQHDN